MTFTNIGEKSMCKSFICIVGAACVAVSIVSQLFAAESSEPWVNPDPAAIEKWQKMRFGMFIHWGPVSLSGHEISWSRGRDISNEEYDNLYKKFNPKKFNADEWVALAKNAGMKYIVLTTRHHDGFCLWDTKFSEYNIMNSPFKRDIVKELSDACKKQGIAFGVYYSICDWHHPDFPYTSPRTRTKREKYDLAAFRRYYRAQLAELAENYGPLLTFWFDGSGHTERKESSDIVRLCRELQPDVLVSDRAYNGYGDYMTPEQEVGQFRMNRPWESCMTVSASDQWSWGGDKDGVKSFDECLKMLIHCAGGDGNILLNIGPEPTGAIADCQANLLKEIGAWMSKYGESIYATRGGPYKPSDRLVSTRKDNKIYLHILAWPEEVVKLPALPAQVVGSRLLGGGQVQVDQTDDGIDIKVPKSDRQEIDTIVVLELNRVAIDIPPIGVPIRK